MSDDGLRVVEAGEVVGAEHGTEAARRDAMAAASGAAR